MMKPEMNAKHCLLYGPPSEISCRVLVSRGADQRDVAYSWPSAIRVSVCVCVCVVSYSVIECLHLACL